MRFPGKVIPSGNSSNNGRLAERGAVVPGPVEFKIVSQFTVYTQFRASSCDSLRFLNVKVRKI